MPTKSKARTTTSARGRRSGPSTPRVQRRLPTEVPPTERNATTPRIDGTTTGNRRSMKPRSGLRGVVSMRMHSIAFCLAILLGDSLSAQTVPLVERMPLPRPAWVAHIGEGSGRVTRYAIIVDSVMVWSAVQASQSGSDSAATLLFTMLQPEDILNLTVLKGATARARGACAGSLLVITTRSGHWRPPAANWTPPAKVDCSHVAP